MTSPSDKRIFKLVWWEDPEGTASVAYGSDWKLEDGVLTFYAEKPIVLSKEVKFVIK